MRWWWSALILASGCQRGREETPNEAPSLHVLAPAPGSVVAGPDADVTFLFEDDHTTPEEATYSFVSDRDGTLDVLVTFHQGVGEARLEALTYGEHGLVVQAFDQESLPASDAVTFTVEVDADGDGYSVSQDCDDTNDAIHPGASELCNQTDDDCDEHVDDDPVDGEAWYPDADGDGFGNPEAEPVWACEPPNDEFVADNGDCDDEADEVHPFTGELCNGVDDDCNGAADDEAIDATPFYADNDGDGFGDDNAVPIWACESPGYAYAEQDNDCDDDDDTIHPGAEEVCNGWEDDCNTLTDETCALETTHCGPITGDTVWDSGVHRVTCTIEVGGAAGPMLTIEPGAEVIFDPGTSLRVASTEAGGLTAVGTPLSPIVFTAFNGTSGSWEGLWFGEHALGSSAIADVIIEKATTNLKLAAIELDLEAVVLRDASIYGLSAEGTSGQWTDLEVGGNAQDNLRLTGTNIDLSDSLIEDAERGIYCSSGPCFGATGGFSGNVLTNHVSVPLRTDHVAEINAFSVTSTFVGNGDDAILVDENQWLQDDQTWTRMDVPYRFSGRVEVGAEVGFPTLTLPAALEVEWGATAAFHLWGHEYSQSNPEKYGVLVVEGATDPVTLRGDGSPGWSMNLGGWGHSIEGLVVEDAVQLRIWANWDLAISGLVVRNGGGIWVASGSFVAFSDCLVENTHGAGIFAETHITLTRCSIDGATGYGVRLSGQGGGDGMFDSEITNTRADGLGNAVGLRLDPGASGYFWQNVITGNGTYPVEISTSQQAATQFGEWTNSDFTGNGIDEIQIPGGTFSGGTLHGTGIPWRVTGDLVVTALWIEGAELRFDAGVGLHAGSLATPQSSDLVIENSVLTASDPMSPWAGVRIEPGFQSPRIEDSVFTYGGTGGALLWIEAVNDVIVDGNTFDHSSGYGVRCPGGCASYATYGANQFGTQTLAWGETN